MTDDHVTERYALNGMRVSNLRFELPLAHPGLAGTATRATGRTITVFARDVVAAEKRDAGLPTLVFFQDGPGGASPRPETRSGWLGQALKEHRVLLLDQRGTGLSTPVTP